MSSFTFANNFSTTLAAAATTSDVTLTLTATTNFPSSIPANEYVPVILLDAATKSVYEVCYASAIAGSDITVARAQENTTAQAWSIGDYIYCAPTAGTVLPVGVALKNGFDGSNITEVTTSATLTIDQSGQFIDTTGLSAAATVTLPASPTKGLFYTVQSNATYQVTMSPNGQNFQFPDASTSSANYALNIAADNNVTIFFNGTYWVVFQTGRMIIADGVNANEAVSFGQVLGLGQTWQDMTASRALNTTYTNLTGKAISVRVVIDATSSASSYLTVDGLAIDYDYSSTGNYQTLRAEIEPQGSYIASNNSGTLVGWYEWR